MSDILPLSYRECCIEIIANQRQPAVSYAVGYARAGLEFSGEDARVQALYILNNISSWRGPTARNVRAGLKAFAGVK